MTPYSIAIAGAMVSCPGCVAGVGCPYADVYKKENVDEIMYYSYLIHLGQNQAHSKIMLKARAASSVLSMKTQ